MYNADSSLAHTHAHRHTHTHAYERIHSPYICVHADILSGTQTLTL